MNLLRRVTQKPAWTIALVAWLSFLLWSRFWALDTLPATMPHDETVYAIQAQSMVLQGTSLDKSQAWWGLTPQHPMYAEWPALVLLPGFLLSDHALLATHLVPAVMGVLFPLLVGLLTWYFWKRRDVAIAAVVVTTFNPLFWQMSRLSYDAFFSLWLYIAATVLLLRRAWWSVALSLPLFVLGFFQYQGFKLLLVPWLCFVLALMFLEDFEWKRWQRKLVKSFTAQTWNQRWILAALMGAVLLTLYYGLVLLPQQSSVSRLTSIVFNDTELLSQTVNDERRLSMTSSLAPLASNKATAVVVFMLQRLLGVFNPYLLLMSVEPNVSGFSVWTHGIFYWLELVLFVIGLSALFHLKPSQLIRSGIYVVGILTLCLPALINTGSEWYVLRSMMSYLLLIPVIAWGTTALWNHFPQWRVILVGLYALSIANFGYHYWYRYPIISLDWGNFDERILARYVWLHHSAYPETPITVYSDEPEYMFWSYLVYNNALTRDNADAVAEAMRKTPPFSNRGEYQLDNLTFTSFCAPKEPQSVQTTLEAPELWIVRQLHQTCPEQEDAPALVPSKTYTPPPILSVQAVLDSGERFRIFGNQLCTANLNTFVHVQKLNDLRIEQQPAAEFCSRWIKDLSSIR